MPRLNSDWSHNLRYCYRVPKLQLRLSLTTSTYQIYFSVYSLHFRSRLVALDVCKIHVDLFSHLYTDTHIPSAHFITFKVAVGALEIQQCSYG